MIVHRLVHRARLLTVCLATAVLAPPAFAAPDKVVAWASLTPAQQQVLAPLQRDWSTLEPNRRQKWVEVAARFPAMPADERQRVQERMAEWARLTPAERIQARRQFQEVRQLPAEERQAKWQAYQALPEAERQSLAQRAQPAAKGSAASDAALKAKPSDAVANRAGGGASAAARTLPAMVVQVRPGATTTTMSARALPPRPAASGAPKIAATAGNVDPATLLPRRGPQVSAPASGSDSSDQQ